MSETLDGVLAYLGEKKVALKVAGPAAKALPKGSSVSAKPGALQRAGRLVLRGTSSDALPAAKPARTRILYAEVKAPQLSNGAIANLAGKLEIDPDYLMWVTDISPRTLQRRIAEKQPLTQAESDRVLRVARIAKDAEKVFGDPAKASRWLSTQSRILGAPPLDLLATDAGTRDVEDELIRIEHGDFA